MSDTTPESTPPPEPEPSSAPEPAPAAAPSPAPPPPAPAAAAGANTGPLGQERGIGFAIVMSLVTLGIYALYWLYKSFSETRAHRGEGLHPIVGVLLCLVLVGYFLLGQSIGRMYAAEGNQNPPVSGLSGLWVFVPYVGGFIFIAKVQGALNQYWKAKGAGAVATAPATTF